jgi:anti-sigma regulatory factor (Ser/Thr protein kinase)
VCVQTPRAELALKMELSAPCQARAFVRAQHCHTHDGAVLDDALLLVSEMVTNAVLHGAPPLVVAVECAGPSLEIRVRDGSPDLPRQRQARADDENGRGMLLMSSIAQSWGVDTLERGGKEVWFRLERTG